MSERTGNAPAEGQVACRCGRAVEPPHCPRCGSAVVQAVTKVGRNEVVGGVKVFVRGFRCRRCGQTFQEDAVCAAPPKVVGSKLRSRSEIDKAVSKIPNSEKRLAEAREAVVKLFRSKGMELPEALRPPEPTAPQAEPQAEPTADEVNSSDEARKRGEFKDHFFGK